MGGVSYFYGMLTFLEETINAILKAHPNIADLTIILPSKRAGGFLKNYLRKTASKTTFSPQIISIEEFIEELSDLKIANTTELLFKSYNAYLSTDEIIEKDSLENYVSWANTLLNDFNEIDRYLLDPKAFFSYLSNIQDLNHWYVKENKTPLIQNYLNFWNNLLPLYENIKTTLFNQGIGYQGMIYREAAENIEHYTSNNPHKKHIFIGFNALNTAEQQIIQELLETGNTEIYWDTDVHFHSDQHHSASLFLRGYLSKWKYYENRSFNDASNNFSKPKKIRVVETSKNMGQVKYLGELLSEYSKEQLNNTAIVLADESLLIPTLNSLPSNIPTINITMGVPLKTFPSTNFFELLLLLHQKDTKTIYYKDLLALLNHPLAPKILPKSKQVINYVAQQNITYVEFNLLQNLFDKDKNGSLTTLLGDWGNSSHVATDNCLQLLKLLKKDTWENDFDRVVHFELFALFQRIESLNNTYPYLETVKTTHRIFSELISTTSLDFIGDAYQGLQIMGVLETRVLDFENIILLSVNEGVLPSGKSNNSFITYDLKQQFGLPLYTEKDAIYTYHFYHMLHRANEVTLMYSSFSDGLSSGEKSRFILQLEVEKHPNHTLEKIVVAPTVSVQPHALRTIQKNQDIMNRLEEIGAKGFSPSALTSYIRNPLDFYSQKILKINEFQEVEETVAFNTLGTIVHDTLQEFYEPLEGTFLSTETLLAMKARVEVVVRSQFKKTFKSGGFNKGKNLIIFEVAKRYISNFIELELLALRNGDRIKILKIETELKAEIPIRELDFPVYIGGKVDRIDEYNGTKRIVDYKTGFVGRTDLEILHWNEITKDYKFSKIIQVLAYALMVDKETPISKIEAGIISFKNLNSGFLKFGTKTATRGPKDQLITQETLALFREELKTLIIEICNVEVPFTEKEIP